MKRTNSLSPIPSLGNAHYSIAHVSDHNVFDKNDRKRVATQIYVTICDFLKKGNTKNLTCLDIGCSTGIISDFLSRYFKRVHGIEIDPHAIELAKKHFKKKNLSFSVGSAMDLNFKSNSLDVIICSEIYSYVDNPQKLMKEIFKILKPGGICYFTGDNLLFPIESQYKVPFLLYAPDLIAKRILKLLGHKNYYLGHYKTYWGLKKLCKDFIIHDYTTKILQDPEKYKFIRLYKYKKFTRAVPHYVISTLIPFMPTFVWILEKPNN